MRPLRLELAGFTSFREQTIVDFDGADYFALVGPTGSGKSTIIDAICFALYGSVPRYAHQGLVAPVISQGRLEARVRLDFTINDVAHTAVRVVRRAGKGATTKEARLERDDEVLAGNADELTEQVTRLIGLSFEHFTKCVVLPQGEFARFLHDKPSVRQDLLIKLLNLGIYDVMRQNAATRAATAKDRVTLVEQLLQDELAFATPDALRAAGRRVKALAALKRKLDTAAPKIDELGHKADAALTEAAEAKRWIARLQALDVPPEMTALADEIEAAGKLLGEAAETSTAALARVNVAAEALAALPGRAPLEAARDTHKRRDDLSTRAAQGKAELEALSSALLATDAAVAAGELALATAQQRRATLAHEHLAHELGASLIAGEPCPVCLQPVVVPPTRRKPKALGTADAAVAEALRRRDHAQQELSRGREEVAGARAAAEVLASQIAELDGELAAHPDLAEVESRLCDIDAADQELEAARALQAEAGRHLERARTAQAALKTKEQRLRQRFEDERDELVALAPPPARRDNLAEDWRELVAWASARIAPLIRSATDAEAAGARSLAGRDRLITELADACAACDVDTTGEGDIGALVEAVVTARAHAQNDVDRIDDALAKADRLRTERDGLVLEQQRAHALAEHLSGKAGKFESWIVNEALGHLVTGATVILDELSGGKYGLTIDDTGNFLVMDHDNADETRSARTLSGGETFLASLSLALGLADQLADLATEGAARLEAIFLDEGFGTLDPDTLDTVAATVENLAAGGRMVGVVTHVAELADRVALQFRVRKDARTSTVERVSL